MRAVHRVAGLEGDDFVPAALLDLVANLHGSAEGRRELGLEIAVVQHFDRARQQRIAQCGEHRDAGMLGIERAENLLGHELDLLVRDVLDSGDVHDCEHWIAVDIRIAQRDAAAGLHARCLRDVDDRHRPEQARRRVQLLGDAQGIGEIHVAGQRIEVTGAEHHGVRCSGRIQQQARKRRRVLEQRRTPRVIGDKQRL